MTHVAVLSFILGAVFIVSAALLVLFGMAAKDNFKLQQLAQQLAEERRLALNALEAVTSTLEHTVEQIRDHPMVKVDSRNLIEVSSLIANARKVLAMPGEAPETGVIDALEGPKRKWPFNDDGKVDVRDAPR